MTTNIYIAEVNRVIDRITCGATRIHDTEAVALADMMMNHVGTETAARNILRRRGYPC